MNFKQLEDILNEEKNKLGLVGGLLKVIPLKREPDFPNFSAFIDPRDWHEEIRIDPDFKPQEDKDIAPYLNKKKIKEPVLTVGKDLVWHETGHWELPYGSEKGCPYDIEHHEKIFEAVTEVLKRKGKWKGEEDECLARYMANAFEDFCVNPNVVLKKNSFDGQVIFWYDVGKCSKKEKFSPFYEAFVKLNLALWGDKDSYQLLNRFFIKNPVIKKKIKGAIKGVLSDCNLGKSLEKNAETLMDKESWPELASKFAHNLADLIDKSQLASMPQTFGTGQSKEKNSGSYFDKKMGDKQVKKQIVKGRYARGEKAPSYMESFEALDLLYQQLASELIIKAETSQKSSAMPIVPYNHEVFDPEKHDIEKINWRKFAVNEKGDVTFQVPRQHYKLVIPVKETAKGFPDIKFLIDTSGSMESGGDEGYDPGSTTFIPWGDKSKYHYALLGFYGALKYLQLKNIAPYITYDLINFSGESIASGEKQYKDLAGVRKLALTPQFDGTELDDSVLKETLNTKPSVVLMLSDGDIYNWGSIRKDFKQLIDRHLFSFIKIGGESDTSKDIKKWSKPVYSVNNAKDLSKLMIDLTKESYKNYKFAV